LAMINNPLLNGMLFYQYGIPGAEFCQVQFKSMYSSWPVHD